MKWMVMYEYEVPGGALNFSSTKVPRPWSPWESSPSRRTGNRTRDIMISSQKLWPLDQEPDRYENSTWIFLTEKSCLVRRNTHFIFRKCQWSELYHEVSIVVPTDVHVLSVFNSFFFIFKLLHHSTFSCVIILTYTSRYIEYVSALTCLLAPVF
jgi:hypothetical protein